MKTMKRIIYSLLGLLLLGTVALIGVILFAEYSGNRFNPIGDTLEQVAFSEDETRLAYDEYGNLIELPGISSAGEAPQEDSETGTLPISPSETSADTASSIPDIPDSSVIPESSVTESAEQTYIMDKSANLFHTSDCSIAQEIAAESRSEMTTTREKILNAGYSACTNCNP